MDDWTYTYPDVDPPETQPRLLFEDGRVIEARRPRALQAEAARVASREQTQAVEVVGNQAEVDVPLRFTTPASAAPAF